MLPPGFEPGYPPFSITSEIEALVKTKPVLERTESIISTIQLSAVTREGGIFDLWITGAYGLIRKVV
jgi:hypothetical protein